MPCSSTGTGTTSSPAERIVPQVSSSDGSSTAIAPRARAPPARGTTSHSALRVAARDDEPPGAGATPRTRTEVRGQLRAQHRVAARVAVVERRVGQLGHRPPQRRRPRAAAGTRDRSGAVARRSTRAARARAPRASAPAAGRAAAAARTTGALPRRTSIQPSAASCAYASLTTPRETPSARPARARRAGACRRGAAAGDRGAARVLELRAQRLARAVERREELQSGSVSRHRSGPVETGHSHGTVSGHERHARAARRPAVGHGGDDPGRAGPGGADPGLARRGRGRRVDPRGRRRWSLVGCGTSEHAAMAGAALLAGARSRDAFEACARPAGRRRAASPSRTRARPRRRSPRCRRRTTARARSLITAKPRRADRAGHHRRARRSWTRRGATPSATSRRCSRFTAIAGAADAADVSRA